MKDIKDYYKTLDVHRDSTPDAIKKSYRKLALYLHPDRGGDEAQFKLLSEAYQTLSDPVKRQNYDVTYGIFQETNLEDSTVFTHHALLMPGKAKPYSLSYQEEHRALATQYYVSPLKAGMPYFHTQTFELNLYSLQRHGENNTYHTVYQYINALNYYHVDSKLKPPETLTLTPRGMLRILHAFLRGGYCGVELRKFIFDIGVELEKNKTDPDYLFYQGIYEIISMINNGEDNHSQLIFSIKKISDYAKNLDENNFRFIAPLFYNKYFRGLYGYALHLYWDDGKVFGEERLDAFDGREKIKRYVELLQHKLNSNNDKDNLINIYRFVKMLFQFDKDTKRSFPGESLAEQHRKKAFQLLDWLPFIMEGGNKEIVTNVFLQIGLAFQQAAWVEVYPALQMADEALALKMYMRALGVAHQGTPAQEIYITTHVIKYISAFQFDNLAAKEIVTAFKKRALVIADIFPFFDTIQSNMDFFEGGSKTLDLIRRFLKKLIAIYEYNNSHNEPIVIEHKNSTILYQAYEACIKNWYTDVYDPELEKKFRLDLMDELLFDKGWTLFDVERNVDAEWIMVARDAAGWMIPTRSLPYIEDPAHVKYRSINGVEVNQKTGEIQFFMTPWTPDRPVSEKLFTLFDLYQMLTRNLSSAIFSLDPVDPDLPYHPFNLMRFSPARLFESELLNSMLLTDYILKFLTTHQEVQGQYPFDQRPISHMLKHLPAYLLKIVDDFRKAKHVGTLHRFWIEAEEIDATIDNGDITRMGVGHLKLVVKKHRMERDMHGNLRDAGNEDEGWPIYVLTPTEWHHLLAGRISISGHAMIFIKGSSSLFYWENDAILHAHNAVNYRDPLLRLFGQPRDNSGKISPTTKNMSLLYRITKEMTRQSGIVHRYSAEFIFAHEFTLHYDEFAQYLPEFGRLKELCKMSAIVRFLSGIYQANHQDLAALASLLNGASSSSSSFSPEPEPEVYEKFRTSRDDVSKKISSVFDKIRSDVATSALRKKWTKQLTDVILQIGTLNFTLYSPEVDEICEDYYKQLVKINPGFPAHKIRDAANEQRSTFAQKLSVSKQASVKEQLKGNFSTLLTTATAYQKEFFINALMTKDIQPLLSFLIAYERQKAVQELHSQFSHSAYNDIDEALDDLGWNAAWRVGLSEANSQLREIVRIKAPLEQGFRQLHFAEQVTHSSPAEQCFWVPASVRHDVKLNSQTGLSRYSFFVYGGVSLQPRINVVQGGGPLSGNKVNAGTFNRAQIIKGCQWHHIIPQGGMTKGHPLFQKTGMNVNSAFNTIYLPKDPSRHETRSIHNGGHTKAYSLGIYHNMNRLITRGEAAGWSQQQYRAATRAMLSELRQELRQGNIALNKRHVPPGKEHRGV